MRIFDAIRAPGATVNLVQANGAHRTVRVPGSLSDAAEAATRVVADDCGSWYWKSPRDVWNYEDHFGPMRLPYEQMWIEWKIPKQVFIQGKWGTALPFEACASLVLETKPHDPAPPGTHTTLRTTWFMKTSASSSAVCLPIDQLMHVDADGNYLGSHYVGLEALLEVGNQLHWMFQPAYLAISLMNCRNVEVTDEQPPERLRRATFKRHKVVPLRYSVIRLPGRPDVRSSAQAAEAAGPGVALHTVRGHFKTFTQDKPLLGRHTGTYWWGWQTRGSKDAGEVRKHYAVGPRKAS